MAKLLVKVGDQTVDDEFTNDLIWKDGDIVAVVDNNHEFGKAELASPNFRVVRVSGSRSANAHLIEAEVAQPEDYFPRTMMVNKARRLKLGKTEVVLMGRRRVRAYKLASGDVVERKTAFEAKKRRRHDADHP